MPVAVNCCVLPVRMEAEGGAMVMETRTALVTVRVAEPINVPEVARISVTPAFLARTSPEVEMDATDFLLQLHEIRFVMSCVVPSL